MKKKKQKITVRITNKSGRDIGKIYTEAIAKLYLEGRLNV